MKLASITSTGKTGSVTAHDGLFSAKVNDVLLAQAIRVYMSNKRQGTSKVKGRSEVNLTKRKVYKQKGTGNARHGAKSAPIFVGGGVAHGPTGLENWSRNLSRKMKAKALLSALSAQAENTIIVDGLHDLSGKTKEAVTLLESVLTTSRKVLVVLEARNEKVERALSNIQNISTLTADLINAYHIAGVNKVIMTSGAVKVLEARLLPAEEVAVKAPVKKAATTTKKSAPKKTKTAKKSE